MDCTSSNARYSLNGRWRDVGQIHLGLAGEVGQGVLVLSIRAVNKQRWLEAGDRQGECPTLDRHVAEHTRSGGGPYHRLPRAALRATQTTPDPVRDRRSEVSTHNAHAYAHKHTQPCQSHTQPCQSMVPKWASWRRRGRAMRQNRVFSDAAGVTRTKRTTGDDQQHRTTEPQRRVARYRVGPCRARLLPGASDTGSGITAPCSPSRATGPHTIIRQVADADGTRGWYSQRVYSGGRKGWGMEAEQHSIT